VLIATPLATGFSGTNVAYIPIELTAAGDSIASPVKAAGIVDTGAEITCIPMKLLQQLAIPPTGFIAVATPNNAQTVPTYTIDIRIKRLLLPKVRVVGLEIDYVLLGRDSLKGFTVQLEPSGAVVLYDAAE
jgi:hypothetical protein